jgi:hypothetical protein
MTSLRRTLGFPGRRRARAGGMESKEGARAGIPVAGGTGGRRYTHDGIRTTDER